MEMHFSQGTGWMENLLPDEVHHNNNEKIDPQNANYVGVVNKRQRLINERYKE